jgi:hypothetical protein
VSDKWKHFKARNPIFVNLFFRTSVRLSAHFSFKFCFVCRAFSLFWAYVYLFVQAGLGRAENGLMPATLKTSPSIGWCRSFNGSINRQSRHVTNQVGNSLLGDPI